MVFLGKIGGSSEKVPRWIDGFKKNIKWEEEGTLENKDGDGRTKSSCLWVKRFLAATMEVAVMEGKEVKACLQQDVEGGIHLG